LELERERMELEEMLTQLQILTSPSSVLRDPYSGDYDRRDYLEDEVLGPRNTGNRRSNLGRSRIY
jgi:hypothetical protein